MDAAEARAAAEEILGSDLAGQVADSDWERALAASVTVDPDGRLPGDDDWVASYEPYWLAAEVVEAVALRQVGAGGGITKFTSEGASFEMTAPNLTGLAGRLRAKSPLSALAGEGVGWIDVPRSPLGYEPRSGQAWV